MTDVLAKIEHAGIKINLETLNDIRNEYEHELTTIDKRLKELVSNVMGDTPINLNSADDRSMLFYSRKINNKQTWARLFNIGHEMRGATKKVKMRKPMAKTNFAAAIRNNTQIIRKTTGYQCGTCEGEGRQRFKLKSGQLGKANRLCKNCMRQVLYTLKVNKLQDYASYQETLRMLHKQDLKQIRQLLKVCCHL